MSELNLSKTCELHVHIGGCLSPEHLFELGREHYRQIDWTLYEKSFLKAYGYTPDPIQMFSRAVKDENHRAITHCCVMSKEDSGDFERFQAKYDFGLCIFRYWWHTLGRVNELLNHIFAQHQSEGILYAEYRALAPHDKESSNDLVDFHETIVTALRKACNKNFEARYIVSLPRNSPLECYNIIRQWLDRRPDLLPYVVGFDFCHFEEGFPPRTAQNFFSQLHEDNKRDPKKHFDVTYHVGEIFFDKSLESSVRWCHEAAELGAVRLGHCIALGLDPDISTSRIPNAHSIETVSERIDQIQYDKKHYEELTNWGVKISRQKIEKELQDLQNMPLEKKIEIPYSKNRLAEIRRRQDFVLFRLKKLNVVIEVCPTSNLLMGCVPDPSAHPIHRFIESGVSLAIGSDDPGLFRQSLAEEIDWVPQNSAVSSAKLAQCLKNPFDLRLSHKRNKFVLNK
jgi:adenosine deaminase